VSDKTLVLVTSIGRSGTSLFTGALGRLGVRVPQPEVEANRTNPRGFSEPRWVVDFHAAMMRSARVTLWDSRPAAFSRTHAAADDPARGEELTAWLRVQLVGADRVVVKDPRAAWFLPLWERCAGAVGVRLCHVTPLRHPAEAVRSATTWYGTRQNDTSRTAGWLNVTLEVERATRDRDAPRAFVGYPALVADWRRALARVEEALDLPLVTGLDDASAAEVDALVDPSLRRAQAGWDDLDVSPRVSGLAEEAWDTLCGLTEPGAEGPDRWDSLDRTRSAYAALYAEAEEIVRSSLVAARPPRGKGTAAHPPRGKGTAAHPPRGKGTAVRPPQGRGGAGAKGAGKAGKGRGVSPRAGSSRAASSRAGAPVARRSATVRRLRRNRVVRAVVRRVPAGARRRLKRTVRRSVRVVRGGR
jgi:hypothetical protein